MALDLTWFDVDGDIETFYTYCLHHMEAAMSQSGLCTIESLRQLKIIG